MSGFSDVVEAADKLTVDEQEALLEIIRRRISERNRADLAREVAQSRAEFASGQSRSATAREIMDEASGES